MGISCVFSTYLENVRTGRDAVHRGQTKVERGQRFAKV